VAGTPKAFGFDAQTKTFTLTYTTGRAGGGRLAPGAETEIAVPARQYPKGYAVAVRGANVRHRPGDGMLRMTNCPSAPEVSVKITPGNGVTDTCALPAGVGVRPGRGGGPALRLSVRPRRATAGRTTRFRFQVTGGSGARIRFGGKRASTNRRGRASLRVRFRRPGRRVARATARGAKPARVSVRVVRAR
jgi:hypothetical protein